MSVVPTTGRPGEQGMLPVALFTRSDSNYLALGVECYDIHRDARTYGGSSPVVAHPPCRAWSKFRAFAKPRHDEKACGVWAVEKVRDNGGVLEHPAFSRLWRACSLPSPGAGYDWYGGWTLPVEQWWWGHRAQKSTWLYIVGCEPRDLPPMPYRMGEASHVISWFSGTPKHRRRPLTTKAEREHTPSAFASWLLELAGRCR